MSVKCSSSVCGHSAHFQFLTTLYLLLNYIFKDLCTGKFILVHYWYFFN